MAPLPQVDFPTISVFASMPGASPDTMAATVATPLERHLGIIADVTEMTSQSTVGSARITLQFGLNRDIDGAARDVQAAINAARADLPTSLRNNPTYRKVNPADAPIAILAMTSDTLTRGQIYDAASTVMQQALSQLEGIGQVGISGSSLPAVRVELNPLALFKYGIGLEDVRAALASANAHSPKGAIEDGDRRYQLYTNDQAVRADDYRPLVIAYRDGAAVHLTDVAEVKDSVENLRNQGLANGKTGGAGHSLPAARRQHHRHRRPHKGDPAAAAGINPECHRCLADDGPHDDDPHLAARCRARADDRHRPRHPGRLPLPAQRARHLDPDRGGAGVADRHLRRHVSSRLQPRQSVADGADRLDRLCRRRRDRCARKHHPAYRGRDDADGGGTARRPRGRLYRLVDEPVADRRLRPDPLDGRDHRAALPRVRGDPVGGDPDLAGGVADDDADDVRPSPPNQARRGGRALLPRRGARLRHGAPPLRPFAAVGLARAGLDHGESGGDDRPRRLSLRRYPQGLPAAAGHRADGRRHPGRPEHLVPGDAAKARPVHRHHPQGPGGREHRRLYRRRPDQFRLCLCRAETARRAQDFGRQSDRPTARQAQ